MGDQSQHRHRAGGHEAGGEAAADRARIGHRSRRRRETTQLSDHGYQCGANEMPARRQAHGCRPWIQWPMPAPEFIAIGHVTLDRFGDEVRPGGSALYAVITADRLGLRAGILTSHADDFPLDLVPPRIEVVSVPAPATTVFEHEQVGDDRAQRVTSVAGALSEADVPDDWRDADLVLLAPAVNE